MKNVKVLCVLISLMAAGASAQTPAGGFWGGLPDGPFTPGFRLVEVSDATRSFPSEDGTGLVPRPLRIYVWYPAGRTSAPPMRFDDYVRMALDDFDTSILPVPLSKGLEAGVLEKLRASSVRAVRGAAAAAGKFPLLVLGQGLYYESPLCHFVLCEFLAAHGYVVATCPLVGTRYRLVNITVEDVETEVRDMEFVLSEARSLPFADPVALGAIGYDLGGMAGLLLTMRHPEVRAYLSFDSSILDKHYTGLPVNHPGYHEETFRVPWMHMLQARFIRPEKDRAAAPSLLERKAFGPSYLVHVPTASHGQYSSYAALGIDRAVPGYWGPPAPDTKLVYEGFCRMSLAFLDGHLKQDAAALEGMLRAGAAPGPGLPAFKVESKSGAAAPPAEDGLVKLILDKGIGRARTSIERLHADHPGITLIKESVLNWLGVHFLYWWGREDEAVGVFELNTVLYPGSSNAFDSLGEAYVSHGRKEDAIRSYRKALELDPKNENAKAALERLVPPAKKDPA